MVIPGLASFKNSRDYPRKATQSAVTNSIPVAVASFVTIPANINRTYLTVRDESGSDNIRYSYPLSTNPFLLYGKEAADLESPEAVTIFNVGAAPLNVSVDEGSG